MAEPTLVIEETSVVILALVAAVVVVGMVAVGVGNDEAVLDMVGTTVILAIKAAILQILDP